MDRSRFLSGITVFVLGGLVFLVDLAAPLGVAVWLPYVAVVLLSLWLSTRWQTYTTAGVCIALMLLGLIFSPPGYGPFWVAAVNRLLGGFAIFMAAVVGLAARRTLELEDANRKLQQEIKERERLQSQLLRAQRLESIGVLASGIAHDFNNLLTPILMSVKILRENRPEDERQHLLTTLQASAERGAEMVRQLLAFTGGAVVQGEIVQPRLIIKEIKSILEHTVPKSVQILVNLAEKLKPVSADSTQLAQVLMNLCINARDAMPAGGELRIEAENVLFDEHLAHTHIDARPGNYVRITVADTGGGISADNLDKVFDPFFTTKGPGKGTGLGLSTALGIVRSHGGFINIESEVGKGSRFEVCLPAADEAISDNLKQELPQQARGQGELILVVDDESLILETAKATLEDHGYQVVTALDGREAIDVYQKQQGEIKVVLLDMMMPVMDGPTTMTILRELNPKVRIIASSGLGEKGRAAENLVADQAAFLPKPYTDKQMITTLATVLHSRGGER